VSKVIGQKRRIAAAYSTYSTFTTAYTYVLNAHCIFLYFTMGNGPPHVTPPMCPFPSVGDLKFWTLIPPSQIIMTKGGILDDAWHSNVAAADEHFVYMLNRMAI